MLDFITSAGWIDHLAEYESERQRHVIAIMAGIDGLKRLYSTNFTPLVLARSLGLSAVNALSPVKVRCYPAKLYFTAGRPLSGGEG